MLPFRRFGDAKSLAALDRLERAFKWEVRVLYVVPIGLALRVVAPTAALWSMAVVSLGVLIADGLFSIVVTAVFLRPILQTLHAAGQPQNGLQRGRRGAQRQVKVTINALPPGRLVLLGLVGGGGALTHIPGYG